MNQQLKALISTRAKKFIPSQLFVTNFYFKGTQQFTGCFPNHDWLCYPWQPFLGPSLYQSFKLPFHSQTSWPYLISELLVAGSSWPRTFFTPQVFLFSLTSTACILLGYQLLLT